MIVRPESSLLVVLSLLLCATGRVPATAGSGNYSYDAGVSTGAWGNVAGGDICAIHRFHAIGGADTIFQLEVAFGLPGNTPVPPPGTPITLCVWEDPGDSGDPLQAVLLATAPGTLQNPNSDVLNAYEVPPVAVQGAFWVGYYLSQAPQEFPCAFDGNNAVPGHAWVAGSSVQGTFDPHDLGSNDAPPVLVETHTPGVWLLRAHGMGVEGTPYCFGDGSASSCPCGNESGAGEGAGCANSSGRGASAFGYGGSSAALDDLRVGARNLLPGQPALLFAGESSVAGGAGAPFGDGLRCAAANVVRLGVRFPDHNGIASFGPGLGAQGGFGPGDLRFFQVWYRDPNPPAGSPCGSRFNLTNGLEVVFGP